MKDELVKIAVQVNGKVRGTILVNSEASNEDVLKIAKEQENVKKYLENATIFKEIVIPNKIVNLVIK